MGHVLNLELPFGACANEVLSLNSPSIIKLHKRAGLSLPELEKTDLGPELWVATPPPGGTLGNRFWPANVKTRILTPQYSAKRSFLKELTPDTLTLYSLIILFFYQHFPENA